MSYYFAWRPYVSVAEKRRQADREEAKLKKRGQSIVPVKIEGRAIAKSFWGQAWCTNLERYSDYENRLPRGRSYVRNGSVVDLQIAKGEVTAMVAGSDLYRINIAISPVKASRWKAICRDCAGTIDSLVELLQGRLAKGVMDRVCREGDGLFPSPREIKLSCSCPAPADVSQSWEPETSLCVLIARRMEPERSGSSSQRPLGLSSRVAFVLSLGLSAF
jgi:hypothetical protein